MKLASITGLAFVPLAALHPTAGAHPQVPTLTDTSKVTGAASQPGAGVGAWVSISGDTAVAGTLLSSTQAFVFDRLPDGTWVEAAELQASTGSAVNGPLSVDGDRIVVGSAIDDPFGLGNAGSVFVFERDAGGAGSWGEVAWITLDKPKFQDRFGGSVSLDGDRLMVGAYRRESGAGVTDAGAVFEYALGPGGSYDLEDVIYPPQPTEGAEFGSVVALDGGTLAVATGALTGLYGNRSVHVFVEGSSGWVHQVELFPPDLGPSDNFGVTIALDGDVLAIGAPDKCNQLTNFVCNASGLVYVYARNAGGSNAWGEVQRLTIEGPGVPARQFGQAIDLQGDRLLAGASNTYLNGLPTGAAYLFERRSGSFELAAELRGKDLFYRELFGTGVALDGTRALVGAPRETANGKPYIRNAFASSLRPSDGLIYIPAGLAVFNVSDLVRVDPDSGDLELVGSTGLPQLDGLSFDTLTGALYGMVVDGRLHSIDPDTASATQLGPGIPAPTQMNSLAFDSATGLLYAWDNWFDVLWSIDPATGLPTLIGSIGGVDLSALCFDAETGQLYGIRDPQNPVLVSIDKTNGAVADVQALPFVGVRCLADRAGPDLLQTFTDEGLVVEIPVAAGAASQIAVYASPDLDGPGQVYGFELEGLAASYCTAGISAAGCTALLNANGSPSATAGSGFALQSSGVEGAKDGLFFFGTGGRQANPWGNGTSFQCVVPPVARAGLLTGTGTDGQCDGSFVQDLNALWCPTCPKPAQNPGAGSTVQAQLWYRDPQSTSNQTTSLSNALEFVVGP